MNSENYSLIPLLPRLSKILEKLIKVRFTSYLNKYNIISDSQYGFRTNMSTSGTLIYLIEFVTDVLEKCDICYFVSIDIKKTFDTIYHTILIKKLQLYGIRDTVLNLIISYQNNGKQYVNILDANSTSLYINCGVP